MLSTIYTAAMMGFSEFAISISPVFLSNIRSFRYFYAPFVLIKNISGLSRNSCSRIGPQTAFAITIWENICLRPEFQ